MQQQPSRRDTIGAAFRRIREARGLSQASAGEAVDMSAWQVRSVETSSTRNLYIRIALPLCALYAVRLSDVWALATNDTAPVPPPGARPPAYPDVEALDATLRATFREWRLARDLGTKLVTKRAGVSHNSWLVRLESGQHHHLDLVRLAACATAIEVSPVALIEEAERRAIARESTKAAIAS